MAFAALIVSFFVAAALCATLIPLFRRLFLAIPDARSSHFAATPQGGGLVVAPVALIVASVASFGFAGAKPDAFFSCLCAAVLVLMLLGAWDDLVSLNPALRFLVQTGAAALVLAAAPLDLTGPLALFPPLLIYGCLLIAMVWFINLTNFMDGLDLMSVAQFAPAFATLYLILTDIGGEATSLGLLCLSCAGALLGFSLLNRPVARLFLGDSGSLPLGILGAGAALAVGAWRGPIVAVLPFLYYIADATLTLARRILTGQKFWQAHRDHFYQRAKLRGLATWRIIARVAGCNIALCALALLAVNRSLPLQIASFACGAVAVAALMFDLVRERR